MDNKNRIETNAYNRINIWCSFYIFFFVALSTLVLFMTYNFGLSIVSGADQSFY